MQSSVEEVDILSSKICGREILMRSLDIVSIVIEKEQRYVD